MSGPIDVTIVTDVDDVVSGAEKVADSFENIDDALKDTERAGDAAFEGLADSATDAADKVDGDLSKALKNVSDDVDDAADSFKDIDKSAERAFEGVEDSANDAAKVIDRDLTKALEEVEDKAKSTGDTIGREVSSGTDAAGEGMSDLREESASTAKEAAASFGSIEDAASALQEVAANAFVGFGPAGMAAGIIAAAGIGLAISAMQANADEINENKERVVDMARTIAENGGTLRQSDYISAMEDYGYSIVDTKEWLDIFQEDAITGFEEMGKLSKESGIDLKTAFDGAFGSVKDAEEGLEQVNEKLTDLKEKKEAVYQLEGSIMDPVDTATLESLETLKSKMEDNIKNQQVAEEMEKARRKAIEGTVEATLEDIAALEKKNSLLQDGVTSELDYRDQVEATAQALKDNGATLDINTQAGRDNQRALIDQSDAALEMAQSQLEAGTSADTVASSLMAQREALLLTLDAVTGNRAESERLAEAYGLIPSEVITEVKTNGAVESKAEIEQIPATAETEVNVDDGGDVDAVKGRIGSVEGKEVRIGISEQGTAGMTQETINAIQGKDVRLGITEQGTAGQTQATINAIQGKDVRIDVQDFNTVAQTQGRVDGLRGKDVGVDVQDFNSVAQTQSRIDGIRGRNVDINVNLANLGAVYNELARLTAPRTAWVTINERRGESAP